MTHLMLLFAEILFCCLTLFSHQILALAPSPSPSFSHQNLSNSLHVTINAAMSEAVTALDHMKQMPERALSGCSSFYELTVTHLNQTLNPNPDTAPFDVQIWLSTALTMLENCKTSLSEQNATLPVFLDNKASELITTALAINAELMKVSGPRRGQLQRSHPPKMGRAVIVVAQDGSGKYRTIKEALDASKKMRSSVRVVIKVKKGTYKEYLEISQDMKDVMLVGDGIGKTIITGDRSAQSGFNTLQSATVKVFGPGFIARDITFRNTAGPNAGQAVAFLSSSDRSAYYRCSFEGYQDTLWAASNRQFYRQCHIYGSIDFIFGDAAVVIENSSIFARPPAQHGEGVTITAQGRAGPNEPTGFSFVNCKLRPDPDQSKVLKGFRVFLGRPWRDYSRVVYMRSYMDRMVDPQGWMSWEGKAGKTVFYAEYGNHGRGSATKRRVGWPGVRVIKDEREAEEFSVVNFIDGKQWLPATGVPFSNGL